MGETYVLRARSHSRALDFCLLDSLLVSCVCPRLNNCIGFFNLKYFYLFILYMAVLTAFMLVTMTPVFVHDVTSMESVAIDFTVRAERKRTHRARFCHASKHAR